MSMIRWKPLRDLVGMRQTMERLFEEGYFRPWSALSLLGEQVHPAIDIHQTPNEVVVKAALPGVKPEDVDITIAGDTLTIKGETKAEKEVKGEDCNTAVLHRGFKQKPCSYICLLPMGAEQDPHGSDVGRPG